MATSLVLVVAPVSLVSLLSLLVVSLPLVLVVRCLRAAQIQRRHFHARRDGPAVDRSRLTCQLALVSGRAPPSWLSAPLKSVSHWIGSCSDYNAAF